MTKSKMSERDEVLLLLNELASALITDLLSPKDVRPSVEKLVRRARKANEVILGFSPELRDSIRQRGLDDPANVFPFFSRWQLRFASTGIKTLRDLVRLDEESVRAMKKMGPQSVEAIKKILAPFGLRLGMKNEEIEAVFGPDPRIPHGLNPALLRKWADIDVDVIDISHRAHFLLRRAGITTLRQLLARSEEEIAVIMGHRQLHIQDIKRRLDKLGLRLGLPPEVIERLLGPPPSS